MNKWTDEQILAINTKDCNLLVAAAAGAGKTAVLVERIIQRITNENEEIDIDSLLVVTFTNAAASEMRERVADAITKKLDENPNSRRLQNQLTLLNRANIITIHSFCLDIIRSNFHKIDLDPGFRIGDETETKLLKAEALEELFEEKYSGERDEDFINLVDSYGSSKDDLPLQDMVLDIYRFAISSENPEAWLNKCVEGFNIDDDFTFSDSIWADAILNTAIINLKAAVKIMEEAVNIIKRTPELESYQSQFELELSGISEIYDMSKKSYKELYNALYLFTFERLKGNVKEADKDTKERVQNLRKTVKEDIINPLKEDFSFSNDDIKKEINSIYPSIKTLCALIMDFHRKYADKKKERGIIDFNDIEHFCLNILVDDGQPSEVAKSYREKFNEILIDEYQDSNYIQEAILTSISKDNPKNIFMVGDVKQSIYRFRNAKPELFLDKYNRYSDDKGDERRILLYKNFRSREEVIDGVNYIFTQLMSKNIGEMDYTDREKLNKGADYMEFDDNEHCTANVELNIIEREEMNGEDTYEESEDEEFISNIELEAIAIAKRIKKLLGSDKKAFKVFDRKENKYRNVEHRDIVILLRATSKWSDIFEKVLSIEGIPSFADTGVGYFDTIEIKTIVSLLQIIDNPLQDIPLLGVLRSSMFSFTPDELIDIRMENQQGTFYSALKNQEESSEKIGSFLQKLKAWQDKADYMSTDELIWFLYSDTGYYGYAGAMPGGIQRQANLRILFERAREYEKTSYKGLFNFVYFIDKLKRSSGDMGSAKILGENENVVRIMSIHKSKGLEFPVVILAGCGKNFNKIDLRKKILYHHKLLLGPDFVDYKRRITSTTIIKEAIKRKINVETLSEEMRILYVAITRAKEKLIITGTVKNIKKAASKWAESLNSLNINLDEYDVLKAKSYIDWIGRCVIRHPDAKKLRDEADIEEYQSIFTQENSKWDINLFKRDEILIGKKEEIRAKEDIIKEIKNINIVEYESGYEDEIKRRLDYKYPYKLYTSIPAKLTVSEVKRISEVFDMEEDSYNMFKETVHKKPSFMNKEEKLLAPQIGTLIHTVMQHIDIKDNLDYENIVLQIDKLADRGIIDRNHIEYINISKIQEFFKSEIGIRMLKSNEVRREVPFHIQIPANEIYEGLPNDINEKVMIQGIMDCYFEEEGKFVLIDYKTDYVKNIDEIRQKYEIQIKLYARALEEVTGIKVKNKYIYLLSTGDIIEY